MCVSVSALVVPPLLWRRGQHCVPGELCPELCVPRVTSSGEPFSSFHCCFSPVCYAPERPLPSVASVWQAPALPQLSLWPLATSRVKLHPHLSRLSGGIPPPSAAASPRGTQVIGELISSQGARHQVPKPTDLFPPDPETGPGLAG